MRFTLGGLILAMLFGVFYGSEGRMDAAVFDRVFWGLIITGACLNLLDILWDTICRHCHCRFCAPG